MAAAKENAIVVREDQCKSAILFFLQKKPLTKKDLYVMLQRHFKTDKTEMSDDDNALKGLAGNLLSKLIQSNEIILTNDTYCLPQMDKPNGIGKEPTEEKAFEKAFLERLVANGGAFFEKFVLHLFEKYYMLSGTDVLDGKIIGGTNDGGIDVTIDTIDPLGFADRIMIQAKCRKTIQVTEKEVREFYGALNAYNGTKGIFVTTSTFHPCAEKLLLSINNCVGIDGHKLFDTVKRTTYGIRKNKNGYLFDETIFTF